MPRDLRFFMLATPRPTIISEQFKIGAEHL